MNLKFRKHFNHYKRATYVKDDNDKSDIGSGIEFLDCALGINPFGHTHLLEEALKSFDVAGLNRYPGFPFHHMKEDLALYWQDVAEIRAENIRLGDGSIGILERLNKLFIDSGSKVLGYCPQFTDYMADVESCGGVFEYMALTPDTNFKFNGEKLLSKLNDEHKLIYIDNPNNPTGQVIPLQEVRFIVEEAAKRDICVIVDEAYGDYIDKAESAISIVNEYENLTVVRSFSKGFGLAGIRVGYMISGELIANYYSKVEPIFSINSFGQFAARIAIKDEDFLKGSIKQIKDSKNRILASLTGLNVLETDIRIPIMVLEHPKGDINLQREFYEHGVLTEAGEDFMELGKSYVRFRVPADAERVINIIKKMENRE